MTAVQSSAILSIEYDVARLALAIRFASGSCYVYGGVPAAVFAEFLAAPSKGKYFRFAIRDRYPFVRDAAGADG